MVRRSDKNRDAMPNVGGADRVIRKPAAEGRSEGRFRERRELHVYVVPLVQDVDGRETVLWDPGPIVAWDEGDAVVQAAFELIRCARPVLLRSTTSKPRFRVRRVPTAD